MPTSIFDIKSPAALIEVSRLENNLKRMAMRANHLHVELRPHVKTHKCIEIGRRQREISGSSGITVSTLEEATTFVAHGFNDITWAFPLILNRTRDVLELTKQATVRLLIDSEKALEAIESSGVPVHVWLKIDCGYHRAGVNPTSHLAQELVERLVNSPTIIFDGILSHSGHAYHATSAQEMREIAQQERDVMVSFATQLRDVGIPVPLISIGSTPSMASIDHLSGVDEVRPGNYAFYDWTQVLLGSCDPTDCALSVLASVVSADRSRDRSIIDAGALALSKDSYYTSRGTAGWGQVSSKPTDISSDSLQQQLVSLSQEHGIVNGHNPVGSTVRVVPAHSCLTAACFDAYYVVEGERVIDQWKIWRNR